ncbi:MAG: hypothetical protein WDA22_11685 [Bacteroidota bacterium]
MKFNDFFCEHNCRNTCTALTKALQMESEIVRLCEETLRQCDDDNIKDFMTDLAENSSERVMTIMQKLNEIRARVHILEGISSSFEPHTPPSKKIH